MEVQGGRMEIPSASPRDAGVYACVAASETGVTVWRFSISVTNEAPVHFPARPGPPPPAPSRPDVTDITDTSVTVTWHTRGRTKRDTLALTHHKQMSVAHGDTKAEILYSVEYFSPDTPEVTKYWVFNLLNVFFLNL